MDGLLKTTEKKEVEEEFSFKKFFIPLTTMKAIHWIVIIGLVVYFMSLFNGFVWDDFPQIVNNPTINSLSNIISVFVPPASFKSTMYYRPIPEAIYTLLLTIFGQNAFFFHFLQLVIHITVSVLLFFLFKRFFKRAIAFFLSLTFLVHPLNSEAVLYISALQTNLSLLFGLIALLVALKSKDMTFKRSFLIALLLLLAQLSKETGLLMLLFVVAARSLIFNLKILKRDITLYALLFVELLLYLILRVPLAHVYSGSFITPPIPILQASFLTRLQTVPQILWYYFSHSFFPSKFAISQHWIVASLTLQNFYIPVLLDLLIFIGIGILGIYAFKQHRDCRTAFLFFLLFFLLNLIPLLQFFPLDMTVADRWFYLPVIGVLGLLGLGIDQLRLDKHILTIFVAAGVIVVLSFVTFLRSMDWKNELTLYSHDEKLNTNSFELENLLGKALITNNNDNNAQTHFLHSIQLAPIYWESWDNLGVLYVKEGNISQAEHAYLQAIQNNPSYYNAYLNLAVTYYSYDKADTAKKWIQKSLQIFPDSYQLWNLLALSEVKLGNKTAAMGDVQKAFSLTPNELSNTIYTDLSNDQQVNIPININYNR